MKKLQTTVLIALSSILFTNHAIAQNIPLACQGEENAGMDWENGKWVVARFNLSKFILVKTENSLTTESVAKVLKNKYLTQITCRTTLLGIACIDVVGSSLYFDPKTLKGSTASVFGGTSVGNKRDSVSVEVFSCTAF